MGTDFLVGVTAATAFLVLATGCKSPSSSSNPEGHAAPSAQVGAAVPAPTPETKPPAPAPAPAREGFIEADLKAVLGEYKDNEVRADNQFKGKLIRVSGKVGDVKKDITGAVYVTVGTGAALEMPVVQCMVGQSHEGEAAALSKGQLVTVLGKVEGLMMNVIVRDCTINPELQLCRKLQSAVGGKECSAGYGSASLQFEGDQMGALVSCTGTRGDKSADYVYEEVTQRFLTDKSNPNRVIVGSKTARCFASIFDVDHKPVSDDVRRKAQAFFDAL